MGKWDFFCFCKVTSVYSVDVVVYFCQFETPSICVLYQFVCVQVRVQIVKHFIMYIIHN